jgi:hypothetical protein
MDFLKKGLSRRLRNFETARCFSAYEIDDLTDPFSLSLRRHSHFEAEAPRALSTEISVQRARIYSAKRVLFVARQ